MSREAADGQFSNSDNMALVGVLSTQLLHHLMVRQVPGHREIGTLRTNVDLSSPERMIGCLTMRSAVPQLQDYLTVSAERLPEKVALVCGARR